MARGDLDYCSSTQKIRSKRQDKPKTSVWTRSLDSRRDRGSATVQTLTTICDVAKQDFRHYSLDDSLNTTVFFLTERTKNNGHMIGEAEKLASKQGASETNGQSPIIAA